MPYLHTSITTDVKDKVALPPPLGPGLNLENAARMEVWCSSFSDPGPDYCEFVVFDAAGVEIARRRVEGY